MTKQPLHIIIDGVDKVGKSTVCKLLSEKLGIRLIKMQNMSEHLKTNPELASQAFNESLYNFKDLDFIMDRGYPSSIIYSDLFRRNYNLSYVNEWVKEMKPKVFILIGEPRSKDEFVDENQQAILMSMYFDFSVDRDWKRIEVDDKTPDQVVEEILKQL